MKNKKLNEMVKKYNDINRMTLIILMILFTTIVLLHLDSLLVIIILISYPTIYYYIGEYYFPKKLSEYIEKEELSTLEKMVCFKQYRLPFSKPHHIYKYLIDDELDTFLYDYIYVDVQKLKGRVEDIKFEIFSDEKFIKLEKYEKYRILNYVFYNNKYSRKLDLQKQYSLESIEYNAITKAITLKEMLFDDSKLNKKKYAKFKIGEE